MNAFYSHGKLLISAEYVVLDGAKALALPTKFGQGLEISTHKNQELIWESFDEHKDCWLQITFDLPSLKILRATFNASKDGGDDGLAEKMQNILLEARNLNPGFLKSNKGFYAKSKLGFNRSWGLGSSSTLINNIAQWAKIDAFKLQFKTFGGSGYDIACSQNNTPILYQLNDQKPKVKKVDFKPKFKEQLFFIHLNKKQNSRQAIATYKQHRDRINNQIDRISSISQALINCNSLDDFERLIKEHEALISSIIKESPIQKTLFHDYFGQTKSLGAWGGDFILATGNSDSPAYFKKKGFHTLLPYSQMIL